MEGKRFIHRLKLTNLLSFGPEGVDIELEPLNVLIGPNASGKSNFIEAIGLLQAAPDDLSVPIGQGGGIREWMWKGTDVEAMPKLEAVVEGTKWGPRLRHSMTLAPSGPWAWLPDEEIEEVHDTGSPHYSVLHRDSDDGVGTAVTRDALAKAGPLITIEDFDFGQSALAQVRDATHHPEITVLGRAYARFRLYREWNLGRFAEPRKPQRPDLPGDVLLSDGSNVALVWNYLEHLSATDRITEELRRFYPPIRKITSPVLGGTIQLMLHEEGLKHPVPAVRWSDGTLRYLCLLTILCHPDPPPLVCIEEPELGLHPDIIPRVAELLVEASSRMQLIVTTHSSELVDALSDTPEAVVVCERDDGGTRLERLDPKRLRKWLTEYTLGHLWSMGEIGGNLH